VDLRAGMDDLEKRKFLTLPGVELRSLGRPARRFVAIPTMLSRLLLFWVCVIILCLLYWVRIIVCLRFIVLCCTIVYCCFIVLSVLG
jgi:hypothetical protein